MIKIIDKEFLNKLPEIDTQEYDIFYMSLKDLDIIAKEFNNHVEGKNGPIDFFNLPKGTKVIALEESTNKPVWADAKYWSKHYDREIEIVNLADGSQIITDNDPRAVYGITKENFNKKNYIFERFTPTEAYKQNVLVPKSKESFFIKATDIPLSFSDIADINKTNLSLSTLTCIVTDIFFAANQRLKIIVKDDNWQLKEVKDIDESKIHELDNINLVEILSIDYTGKKEDGYDLTVPGYETFMNTSGIILSNTVNVHVPGLPEAQKDVIEKLLPSRQVYSARHYNEDSGLKVVNPIKQDLLLGLYGAATSKAKNKHVFATREEALKAIRSGKISLSDEVEILNEKES